MALIFAALTAALAALLLGPRSAGPRGAGPRGVGPSGVAAAILVACLLLSAGLFLFEIHDARDGFDMPWLQVRTDRPGRDA